MLTAVVAHWADHRGIHTGFTGAETDDAR